MLVRPVPVLKLQLLYEHRDTGVKAGVEEPLAFLLKFLNGLTYFVERNSSGVELRTLDYEKPGSNPVL